MTTCNLCKKRYSPADPKALAVVQMGLRVELCARCATERMGRALGLIAEVYGEDAKIGELGAEPAEVGQ